MYNQMNLLSDTTVLVCGSTAFWCFKKVNEANSRFSPIGNTIMAPTIPIDLIRASAVVVANKE